MHKILFFPAQCTIYTHILHCSFKQRELRHLCGLNPNVHTVLDPSVITPTRCSGVTIAPPETFYPVGWSEADLLYEHGDSEHWEAFLGGSRTAHYFQSSRDYGRKIMRPGNYGRMVPSLLFLALARDVWYSRSTEREYSHQVTDKCARFPATKSRNLSTYALESFRCASS